jgi:hypothetical protein
MKKIKLVEIEPGRFRVAKPRSDVKRSALPLPNIISDIMPPTEQVDGRFYTSKRAFRAVGRALGLTEVGNEKPRPHPRSLPETRATKDKRRQSIKTAFDKVRAGHRT